MEGEGWGVEETELCLVLWPWSLVYGAHFIINPDRIHRRGDTQTQKHRLTRRERQTDKQPELQAGMGDGWTDRRTDEGRQTEANDRHLSHPPRK